MTSPEDTLKAVEALIGIMTEFVVDQDPDRTQYWRRLCKLKAGCIALRNDVRGDADARAILDRSPL